MLASRTWEVAAFSASSARLANSARVGVKKSHNVRSWETSCHVIDLDDTPHGFPRRHSYSASRNGHDRTRRSFRPCKSQKNLHDGKGQFAVEVVFGNPEPSPVILHGGKDIRWGRSTRMNNYHRPVLKSDVTNGRKGQMASDIVRRNIDL